MNKFDIFISFKNSTSDGSQTRDAQIAEQIYREFCLMGISAFYSNITLLKLGESVYKRSIDHALDTAKILLLISTDPSYIESRWIKYEWESFHTDILNDIKKTRRSSHTPTESLPTPSRAHFATTRTATYSAWTSPLSALSQKRSLKN